LNNIPAKNSNKSYWFTIETYVHISLKKDSLLLYNTLTGDLLEYSQSQHPEVYRLIRRLLSANTLQIVRLSDTEIQDPGISQFLKEMKDRFMGELIDVSYSSGKPIQFPPRVRVNRDVKKLKDQPYRSVGERVMKYLSEITFYITDRCEQNCDICRDAYRQFNCCTSSKGKSHEIIPENIKQVLDETKSAPLNKLHILGGNIFKYSRFAELTRILHESRAKTTFYTHYKCIPTNGENAGVEMLPSNSSIIVFVSLPIHEEQLSMVNRKIKESGLEYRFMFIIENEHDYLKAEQVIESLQIPHADFQPFYNTRNLEFFKENVFVRKEDILESKPGLKEIFAGQVINRVDFGALTILSNGNIHSNTNTSRLGILGKNTIYEALCNEMKKGDSWLKTRINIQPCKQCTFQALCPPVTNYNRVMGRNDLCFRYDKNS
jgi:pseudo-rSAM protein